jgi:16S rRNA G966 N2-methylase RsmD
MFSGSDDEFVMDDTIQDDVVDTHTFELATPKEIQVGDILSVERIKNIYPKCHRFSELRMTDVGLYSVTRREESYYITNLIAKYFAPIQKRFVITDSCSGVGGNGISFLLHPSVEHVHFIEINSLHCDILQHNIQLYGLERKATVHNGNFIEIGPGVMQDVIFHDFPWGGNDYRNAKQLRLGLCRGNEWKKENWIGIDEICNEYKPRTRLQVCKVPTNFAFRHFFEHIEFQKIKIHKVYNRYSRKLYYYLIFLFS